MTQKSNITVSLTSELRLEQALKEAGIKDPAAVTKLTVSGPIADNDLEYINKNLGETLQELDMGDASVDETGIPLGIFDNCTGLDAIVLPKSFIGIPWGIYSICPDLTSITISGQSLHYLLMNEDLYEEYEDDEEDDEDEDEDFDDEGNFDFDEDDEDFDFDGDDDDDDDDE